MGLFVFLWAESQFFRLGFWKWEMGNLGPFSHDLSPPDKARTQESWLHEIKMFGWSSCEFALSGTEETYDPHYVVLFTNSSQLGVSSCPVPSPSNFYFYHELPQQPKILDLEHAKYWFHISHSFGFLSLRFISKIVIPWSVELVILARSRPRSPHC